jgi:hypothetical protein
MEGAGGLAPFVEEKVPANISYCVVILKTFCTSTFALMIFDQAFIAETTIAFECNKFVFNISIYPPFWIVILAALRDDKYQKISVFLKVLYRK